MLLTEQKNRKKVSRTFGATISVGLENFMKNIKSTVLIQIQNSLINRVRVEKFLNPMSSRPNRLDELLFEFVNGVNVIRRSVVS